MTDEGTSSGPPMVLSGSGGVAIEAATIVDAITGQKTEEVSDGDRTED